MNRKFLGDAYDCWKGWLIETLRAEGLVSDLAVDPMACDFHEWQDEDRRLYARLLHVGQDQLLWPEGARSDGDVFLDPDTGVQTGGLHPPERYVTPQRIGALLQAPERLVIVYQHGAQDKSVSDRVDSVAKVLCERLGQLGWSSYESNTVAMLFLSRSHDRTQRIAQHFRKVLSPCAAHRIRESHP